MPSFDTREIEAKLVAVTRSWADELHALLLEQHGEELGNRLFARYGEAFPAAYREDFPARRVKRALPGASLALELRGPLLQEGLRPFLHVPGRADEPEERGLRALRHVQGHVEPVVHRFEHVAE